MSVPPIESHGKALVGGDLSGFSDCAVYEPLVVAVSVGFSIALCVVAAWMVRGQSTSASVYSVSPNQTLGEIDQLHQTLTNAATVGTRTAKAYLDMMPVGLVSTDKNGVIRTANLTALKILRGTLDDLIGKPITMFVRANETDLQLTIEEMKANYMNRLTEVCLNSASADADPVPVDLSLTEYDGVGGAGLLVNFSDLSDRYELQKMREEFVSMVSHDLRSPLGTISMFLSNLVSTRPKVLPDRQLKAAELAQGEAERLLRMVNALLNLSMLRAGRLVIDKHVGDPQSLLLGLAESLRFRASTKDISIAVDADSVQVPFDSDRVYQVAENLVANAIKFSPPHSTIKITGRDTGSGGYRIEVTDSGPGIAIEAQHRIFRRFETGKLEDSKLGGVGLGLAICKLIVEQHGGQMGVISSLGEGSCFWFTLSEQLSGNHSGL